ncbi:YciE/YciF ferroxidase family protein [Natronolimnobius baerhuensis]|uniref:YciE/YciF family protein n=1 Tax=Natronolimnobius baerhuensis TaxID=253108 RepID=A0A202E580_9EURY|nr:DUF892 family protein [Natronolimnobius baerhuensis]OVE83401.1 YciE/YciF family protein [Natronolimnobius baerhuensis]
MNIETIEDLFGYQLQHAYYAERTQIELLSELADETTSDDLERTLTDHRAETEQHVERLEDVFAALGRRPRASRSRTVDGLADARRPDRHGEDPEPTSTVLETALLSERFEIRSYEMLLRLAGRLAYADEIVTPLEAILADERAMRESLAAFEDEAAMARPRREEA